MLGMTVTIEKQTYLPIIYEIRKVKITDSYHKFLGLTRSGVGCEDNRNYFVVMILSILQDIWAIFRWRWRYEGDIVGYGGRVEVKMIWHKYKLRPSQGKHKMWT